MEIALTHRFKNFQFVSNLFGDNGRIHPEVPPSGGSPSGPEQDAEVWPFNTQEGCIDKLCMIFKKGKMEIHNLIYRPNFILANRASSYM